MSKKQERINTIKKQLINEIETNKTLAITGRVKTWLYEQQADSIYPFSCTVYHVEDSMEGESGIEASWLYTSKALRYAAGVSIDLSSLRQKGLDNGKGLVSSGPVSFATIYSKFNEVLRRGGRYKNGGCSIFLNASHPDLKEFLDLSPSDAPWIKKSLYVSEDPTDPDYLLTNPYLEDILYAMRAGTLWLAKKRWDEKGNRLYSNLCLEVLLRSRDTCTLSHINLGQCTLRNIRKAFRDGMRFLCKLHSITGAGENNYYLSAKEGRQVGLGVLGLANYLAKHKIKYEDFTNCLGAFLDMLKINMSIEEICNQLKADGYKKENVAFVRELYLGFQDSAKIATSYKMNRAYVVAPTATCSFNHVDFDGYTTTAEISPPICHPVTKQTVRASGTFGQKEYQYPINVETAAEVGWDTYYQLAQNWQRLMETTGLAHSISFNIWDQCPIDKQWIEDWLKSPLVTTYYRMQVQQDFTDKTAINVGLENADFSNDGFMGDMDTEADNELVKSLLSFLPGIETSIESKTCSLILSEEGSFCSSCAE